MYTVKNFDSWPELEAFALKLAADNDTAGVQFSHFLYRGQASHVWELDTTLERSAPQLSRVSEYYRFARAAKSEIETFTDSRWPDIDYLEIEERFAQYDGNPFVNSFAQ